MILFEYIGGIYIYIYMRQYIIKKGHLFTRGHHSG